MFKQMPNKTCKTLHQNMQNMQNQGTSISCVADGCSLDQNAKKTIMICFFPNKAIFAKQTSKHKAKSQNPLNLDGLAGMAPLDKLP